MDTRPSRAEGQRARGRLLLPALAVVALVVASACGSATPSASGAPSAVASEPSQTTAASPAASTAVDPGGDWIGFHGDGARTGVAPAGPIGHPMLAWQAHAGGGVPQNITIVGEGVYFASDDGVVHALDRVSGDERWTTTLDSPSERGPVAADGRLYLISGDGVPMALDPATGHTLWTASTTYPSPSEVASDGSTLYFGTGDGFLVAIDAATGAERWRLQPSPSTTAVRSPAYQDGRIYAGTAGGGYVAIDAATHSVAWTGDLQGDATGTAAVGAGLAFSGSLIDEPTGHLRAFDAKTGALRWTADRPLLQFPTITDEMLYSATQEGLVAALDPATGHSRWTVQLQGKVRPMAVAGSVLYLGADQEQKVYALDTATGGKLWSFDVDGSNDCCIAVAHGSVYVGTLAGSVYAIGGDGAAITPTPIAAASTAPLPTKAPTAYLAAPVSWSTDLHGMDFAPVSQIAIDPKGRIWAPEAEGGRIAIFDASGSLLDEWGEPGRGPGQFDFTRQNGDGYGTLAFAKDGGFYVLDVGNRRVQRFDAKRQYLGEWGGFGAEPGKYNDPVGIGVAPDGSVWVLDDRRRVVEHYDADGTVLGSFDPFASLVSDDGANSLMVDPQGRIYVSSVAPSQVLVFDAGGALLDTIGDDVFVDQAGDMDTDADGRLYVTQGPGRGDEPGVLVFDSDGSLLGGLGPAGTETGQVDFTGGIAIDPKGGVIVEDSQPETARLMRFAIKP